MIEILTDSCSDLSPELIKQHHIRQIPFVVTIGEISYLDGKEKISGACKKALQSMLVDFKSHLPGIDLKRVFITHTGCDTDAEYLKNELK